MSVHSSWLFAGGTGTPLSAVSVDGTFDDVARTSSMQDGDSVEAAQAAAVGQPLM